MKRLFALILVLTLSVLTFASCENEIGSYLSEYDYEDEVVETVALHLYIPCDSTTAKNARDTVNDRIAAEGNARFTATITVHFVDETNYAADVAAALASRKADATQWKTALAEKETRIYLLNEEIGKTNDKAKLAQLKEELAEAKKTPITYSADLVLVNSLEMMDAIKDDCANLTAYMSGTKYGRLNTQITGTLLSAVRQYGDGKYFAIPNDHAITAGYRYLLINKAKARDELHYSPEELLSLQSLDDAKELVYSDYFRVVALADAEATETSDGWTRVTTEENVILYRASAVSSLGIVVSDDTVAGQLDAIREAALEHIAFDTVFSVADPKKDRYEDKLAFEQDGYYCNVITYPSVTPAEAFLSAFAVVNAVGDVSVDRAMQVIYALDTDQSLHNLLQYGVEGTNYIAKKDSANNVTSIDRKSAQIGENDIYLISLFAAGNQFLSYYNTEGWTADTRANAASHNAESVLLTTP